MDSIENIDGKKRKLPSQEIGKIRAKDLFFTQFYYIIGFSICHADHLDNIHPNFRYKKRKKWN